MGNGFHKASFSQQPIVISNPLLQLVSIKPTGSVMTAMQHRYCIVKQSSSIYYLSLPFNFPCISNQQIKQLQDLVQAAALNRETTMAAPISSSSSLSSSSTASKASLAATTTVTHQLNSFYLYTESVKGLPFNLQIYG